MDDQASTAIAPDRQPPFAQFGGSLRSRLAYSFFACFMGFVAVPLPVVRTDFSRLPGDLVDNRFNNYVLEHGYRYLVGQEPSFWHARFCYPARWTIASSDAHIGNLPIYATFRLFGSGPERAFQLWWLSTFPLTFFATLGTMRWLGLGWIGSTSTAMVFTYGLPIMANVGHAQLFPRYFIPLAVVASWRYLAQPQWRTLALTLMACLGQALCTLYLAFFLGWFLLALTLSALVLRQVTWTSFSSLSRSEVLRQTLVILLGCLALVPILGPYVADDRSVIRPSQEVIIQMLPEPIDWLRPHASAASWTRLNEFFQDSEDSALRSTHLFPGFLGLIGLICGVRSLFASRTASSAHPNEPGRMMAAMAFAFLLCALLFLRVGEWSLYRLLLELPILGHVRGLFRVVIVLMFPLALMIGVSIDGLAHRCEWRFYRMGWAGLVLVLTIWDSRITWADPSQSPLVTTPISESIRRRETLAAAISREPRVQVVHVFYQGELMEELSWQIDAMWAAQMLGLPTTNGWTGHWPKDWYPFQNYSGLFHWLRIHGLLTPETIQGLVTFGTPTGNEQSPEELNWRRQYPPRKLPDDR